MIESRDPMFSPVYVQENGIILTRKCVSDKFLVVRIEAPLELKFFEDFPDRLPKNESVLGIRESPGENSWVFVFPIPVREHTDGGCGATVLVHRTL